MSSRLYGAIDNRWCLVLVIPCLIFGVSLSHAVDLTSSDEDTANTTDIYDRISTLIDSLRVWSERPVSIEDTAFTGKDTFDFSELFPGSVIEPLDTTGTIRISLPRYMDLLTSSLLLISQDSPQSGSRSLWRVPVKGEDDHLLIDDVAIRCDSLIVNDSTLLRRIGAHLAHLRTIGLPNHLQAPYFTSDTTEVTVTIRGRDIIDIRFSKDAWLWSIRQLAGGWQVYAGLLSADSNVNVTNLRYYILITYPEATGHHFLEWLERLNKAGDVWHTEAIEVIFTPYIRTDNLNNLFAQPSISDRKPIELKIK